MNPDKITNNSADDILTDALLSEHARLGGEGSDEALVNEILLNTVRAPIEVDFATVKNPPRPSHRMNFADWAKVAAIVLVIGFLGVLLLNQFNTDGSNLTSVEDDARTEDVFHVVIKSAPKADTVDQAPKTMAQRKIELSHTKPVMGGNSYQIAITEIPALLPGEDNFEQSMVLVDNAPIELPSFTLAANDTVKTKDKVIYSGEVLLTHQDFVIEADSVAMGTSTSEKGLIKALNANLVCANHAIETRAESISYDPVSGTLVARGIREFLKDGQSQNLFDASTLVLDSKKYTIQ